MLVYTLSRFIKWMPFDSNRWNDETFVPFKEMMDTIQTEFPTINLLSTLQSDIDSDWSLNTGSWYFNGKAYQNVSYPEETGSFLVGHGTTGNMVWTLLRDVANPSSDDTYFPKFRHFSWFLGHSYSHGVTPMADAKDEESTSEDVNFFYGMMLWGKVTEKKAVEDLGSLMLRLNARAVRTYFLMTSDNTIHPPQFVPNHVTGIFFDNKVDYATWFSAEKYCIHGIQMTRSCKLTFPSENCSMEPMKSSNCAVAFETLRVRLEYIDRGSHRFGLVETSMAVEVTSLNAVGSPLRSLHVLQLASEKRTLENVGRERKSTLSDSDIHGVSAEADILHSWTTLGEYLQHLKG
eukprot:jgi/Phyca11/19870/fgenesh1_pg.PHYCAscaffold_53_\